MYPSLPKQDVITEVVRRINDENFKPSMNKKALIELVIISVEFMSFSCNGQYFDQKDGLPFLDCLIKRDNEGRLQKETYITYMTILTLYIKSTRTCKNRHHKNTSKKSKNCLQH